MGLKVIKAISYLLIIRISVFLFFHEKPMKAITIQEISYDRNDKV